MGRKCFIIQDNQAPWKIINCASKSDLYCKCFRIQEFLLSHSSVLCVFNTLFLIKSHCICMCVCKLWERVEIERIFSLILWYCWKNWSQWLTMNVALHEWNYFIRELFVFPPNWNIITVVICLTIKSIKRRKASCFNIIIVMFLIRSR